MAGKGYKIADAYVAITLNRDGLRDDLAKLPAEMDPAVEKAAKGTGKKGGKALGDGMREGTDGKKVGEDVVDDVEKGAAPKAKPSGGRTGDKMAQGMQDSFVKKSPLIAAVIAGGLIAGGPLIAAAGGALMVGLAAVLEKDNPAVQSALNGVESAFSDSFGQVAAVTAPMLVDALHTVRDSASELAATAAPAFAHLAPAIDGVVGGIVDLARNALPGLTSMIQASAPVFAGLQTFLGDLGSGLGGLFAELGQHAVAFGQVFSSLGSIFQSILPALGVLLGEGGELASVVLPPLASALGVVADVLHVLAPVLPMIAAGLGAFLIVKQLTGPLEHLGAKFQTVAADADGLKGKMAGLGAQGVSKLSGALPGIGAALAIVTAAFAADQETVNGWAQALHQGGQAAVDARSQMSQLDSFVKDNTSGLKGFLADVVGVGNGLRIAGTESGRAKDAAAALDAAMTPLQTAQKAASDSQDALNEAVATYGPHSEQARAAAVNYASAQATLNGIQDDAKNAADAVASSVEGTTAQLQAVANKASAASSQINLLKGALDALTGKQVSMVQAEDQVTQAIDAATASTKNQSGALVVGNDLMGTHTAKAAAAREALIQVASSSNQLIATMEQQGYTTQEVTTRDGQLRDSFIQTARNMGYTQAQAKQLADQIYGIPGQRTSTITADIRNQGGLDALLRTINAIPNGKVVTVTAVANGFGAIHNALSGIFGNTGGQVGGLGRRVIKRASGGLVSGPGTSTQDLAGPFPTTTGDAAYFSPDEWVIQATSARGYGMRAMASVNAGTATITTPDGKTAGPGAGGGGITVQQLTVAITGTLDFTDPSAARKAAVGIRDALVRLEREQR